jgi:zinc D-Ala-D-Ala dipeptidase
MHLPLHRCPPALLVLAGAMAACARPPQHPRALPSPSTVASANPVPATSRQLLVVTSATWDAVPATLYRFERGSGTDTWRAQGVAVPVVLGRTGLAWGTGLADVTGESGPIKHEGDGRSPAGVFRLGTAFGFGPADSVGPLRVPYRQLTAATDCVDDPGSAHYNTLAERDGGPHVDWTSAEHMRSVDPEYRIGIVVDHNTAPRAPGRGSCIFIHVWESPTTPTSGCTALDRGTLADILRWLDASADPVLVQLTADEYDAHQTRWALPSLR